MKKLSYLPLACFVLFCGLSTAFSQSPDIKPLAHNIQNLKDESIPFTNKELLIIEEYPAARSINVKNATYAKIQFDILTEVIAEKPEALTLSIPYKNNRTIELELAQVNLFAEGFIVETSDGSPVNYNKGVYYQGIVKDKPETVVAISVFENEIMGVISTAEDGNINIGRNAAGDEDDYIIYADLDVINPPASGCATPEDYNFSDQNPDQKIISGNSRTLKTVDLYVEADYQLYQNKLTVTNTTNYLTGVFNNAQSIYTNDGISILLSEIFVWTTTDPYSSVSSYSALTSFEGYRTTFNGDVAQLCALDPGGLGGIAATVDGLCNSYKYCYSDIDATYLDLPSYSWTVEVFTHELGHILGAHHTHWCGWAIGALDNCGPSAGYATEGGCVAGPPPVGGGTVMSYCHLTGYGINLMNGFGFYPADAIISNVESSDCLTGGGGAATYCASSGTSTVNEWIDRVKIGLIDRISVTDFGYFDATILSTTIKQGASKTIRFSAGMLGTVHTQYWTIWVDWNHDMDFNDVDEQEVSLSSSSAGNLTATISAPATATPGMTRMRVSMKRDAASTSCENFTNGEVEDYSINITAAMPGEMVASEPELFIYPNPFRNEINLQLSNLTDEKCSISVADISGKMVYEQPSTETNGNLIIQLPDLISGIYFVKVVTASGVVITQQLVKE